MSRAPELSATQVRILQIVERGICDEDDCYEVLTDDVADEMGISARTVSDHVGKIARKLRVYERVRMIELVDEARKQGVDLDVDPAVLAAQRIAARAGVDIGDDPY